MSEKIPKPLDYDQLFPGRFLKAGILNDQPATLTISAVDAESMPSTDDKGKSKEKVRGIVTFRETDMQLALNVTNAQLIKGMFGRKPQEWVGKRVTVAPATDKFGRETVACIRVIGSPDLGGDIDVDVVLPKKKPKTHRLTRTGGQARASVPVAPKAQEVTPEIVEATGPCEQALAFVAQINSALSEDSLLVLAREIKACAFKGVDDAAVRAAYAAKLGQLKSARTPGSEG